MGIAGNFAFAFFYDTLVDLFGNSWLGGDVVICLFAVGLSRFILN